MLRRFRYQRYTVGDNQIRLRTPRDLDLDAQDRKVPGISREAFPLAGIVWASSEVLAGYLDQNDLSGKRVLEVGCGMALVSHSLNHRNVDITALDIHPMSAKFAASNCRLNRTKPIPFVTGSWGEAHEGLGRFHLIVGGDILYEPRHVSTLAMFLDAHTMLQGGEVVIVEPDRGQSDSFHEDMIDVGFSVRSFRPDFSDSLDVPFTGTIYHYRR